MLSTSAAATVTHIRLDTSIPNGQGFVPRATADREALFADFQPLVKRLIRQYGDDPDLRQELLGEIYCRFNDLLDAYDPQRGIPLRPYLVRQLTAAVYTYARSCWKRRQREVRMDHDPDESQSPQVAIDPTGRWDQDLLRGEVLRELPAAIAQLPPRQKQVVISRFYASLSFEEMAETMRIRPATVRSLLRHGLNNLRRKMQRAGLVPE